MRKGALATALAGVLLFSGSALAVNWVKVGEDMDGHATYLDVESFARLDRQSFRLQVKSVAPEGPPQPESTPVEYSLQDFRINCDTNMISTQRVALYAKDGSKLNELVGEPEKPIAPDSLPDLIAKEMCPKLTSHE